MPWHLPADLRHFRQLTWGKPVLMGRRTFVAIGRPLPGRRNILVTRQPDLYYPEHPDLIITHDLPAALAAAGQAAEARPGVRPGHKAEVMIIGGASLYQALLPQARRIYLTEIDGDVGGGDAFFPALAAEEWQIVEEQVQPADGQPPYPYRFLTLVRISAANRPNVGYNLALMRSRLA